MALHIDEVESPLGAIAVVVAGEALCALDFVDCRDRMMGLLSARFGAVRLSARRDPLGCTGRLRDYLAGDLCALNAVAVAPGGTAFQQQVWAALRRIEPDSTLTYGELAASIARPRAVRAVGLANARNPISIAIPCHRIIGATGQLTGYAGGLWRKRWLLEHEGALERQLPL